MSEPWKILTEGDDGALHYREIAAEDAPALYEVLTDAIWQALDSEQGMPHSGVDASYVIPEFLRLLDEAGYTITPKDGH